MSFLEGAVSLIAAALVVVGLFTLVATWAAPRILEHRFMRWLVTGRRLAPTRANRALMACWAALIGGYLLLSVGGYYVLSVIVLVAWLPLAFVVIKRTWWPAPKA